MRPRSGSAYQKHGVIVVAVRLRAGSPRARWVARCPDREDGGPTDLIYARAVAAELQRKYDAGEWEPSQTKGAAPLVARSAAPAPRSERGSPSPAAPARMVAGPTTVLGFARTWVATQTYESAPKDCRRVELYVANSPIASIPLAELRPKNVLAFIGWLNVQPSKRGGTLAARTIRNAYDVLRRSLDAAVIDEVLVANPCAPLRGKLPAIRDKVPGARQGWLYARDEIVRLITDARIPEVRRVSYALQFLTGMRVGELAVLRWSDYDPTMKPLGRLTIARAVKSMSKREAETKTAAVKLVPVHPTLALVLARWHREGWPTYTGRKPAPGDLVVPNQFGRVRNTNRHNRDLRRDCKKLEIEHRHQHAMRHTFITLVQDHGADGNLIRWITHAPPRSAFDSYTRGLWSRLCAEMSKLRVHLPPPTRSRTRLAQEVVPFSAAEAARDAGRSPHRSVTVTE